MSKTAGEVIFKVLGSTFATHKTGHAFREVKALAAKRDALQGFNEGQLRNGLDYLVEQKKLRKVAHPSIKLSDQKTAALAFTSVDNPHTKEKPDYSLSEHPAFARNRLPHRKLGVVGAPEEKRAVGKNAAKTVELLKDHEGIGRHEFLLLLAAHLELREGGAQYQIKAAIKRGEILEFGSRAHTTLMTKAYRKEQEREQARKDKEARELEAAPEVKAEPQPINGTEVEQAPIYTPQAAPAASYIADPIAHNLRGLAEALADTFTTYLVQRLTSNLGQIMGSFGRPEEVRPDALKGAVDSLQIEPRDKKQKVVVIGLLPSQAGMMQTEYGQRLNLTFIGTDDMTRARAAAGHADHVIGMTNFMNHPIEGQVKTHPGYVRISGGLTQLRQKLQNFAQQATH